MSLTRMNGKTEEEETSVDTVLVSSTHNPATITVNSNHDGPEATLFEVPAERAVLETLEERRGRRRSHLVVNTTCFIVSLGFSIVLTGVWPYLRQLEPGVSKDMLGWVIAANPIGQMISSPLMGLWSNRASSSRGAFVATLALFCLGNFLYAILSVFGSAAFSVMIISRFIVGIGSANMTLIRSYISASTTVRERTTAVSLTSAAQAIGYIIGPGAMNLVSSLSSSFSGIVSGKAIQTALAVGFSEDTSGATNATDVIDMEDGEEAVVSNTGIQWNMYTATGWISCFLGLINLVLYLPCIFQEYNIAAKEAHHQKRAANDETAKFPKPDYVPLFGILVTFFVSVMIYVLIETLMVPMCMDLYAWTDEQAITVVGIGLSIAAVLCFLIFIFISFITKVIDERIVLIGGIVSMVVSMIVFIPMGSTYPKMKNCTFIDPLTSHVNETLSIADHFHVTPSPGISNVNDILNYTTREPIVLTTSESEVPTPMPPRINSSSRSLRRQRRHVSHIGDCEDSGCPPEQEWCFYTPIIELPQMGIASFFGVLGYPVTFTLSSALFSKILGPNPQGLWMGILISTGSLSRATGPIMVSYIYTEFGTRWTFSILGCAMFCVLVPNFILYKRLVSMNVLRRR